MSIYRLWVEACSEIGLPAITTDTSAKLMAILLVYGGGCENFVMSDKFQADHQYIQDRFRLHGSCIPDADFTIMLRVYVEELKNCPDPPEWVNSLLEERYGFRLTSKQNK